MKKSEMYHLAQLCVIACECVNVAWVDRLDTLKMLIEAEVLAKFSEDYAEKKECAENV